MDEISLQEEAESLNLSEDSNEDQMDFDYAEQTLHT